MTTPKILGLLFAPGLGGVNCNSIEHVQNLRSNDVVEPERRAVFIMTQ